MCFSPPPDLTINHHSKPSIDSTRQLTLQPAPIIGPRAWTSGYPLGPSDPTRARSSGRRPPAGEHRSRAAGAARALARAPQAKPSDAPLPGPGCLQTHRQLPSEHTDPRASARPLRSRCSQALASQGQGRTVHLVLGQWTPTANPWTSLARHFPGNGYPNRCPARTLPVIAHAKARYLHLTTCKLTRLGGGGFRTSGGGKLT